VTSRLRSRAEQNRNGLFSRAPETQWITHIHVSVTHAETSKPLGQSEWTKYDFKETEAWIQDSEVLDISVVSVSAVKAIPRAGCEVVFETDV